MQNVTPLTTKIRAGMVGGGPGAFIGAVHRMAATLDGDIELVCGNFSGDPDRSRTQGQLLGLDPRRVYPSFATLLAQEAQLPPQERVQFLIIVTPNHLHFPMAAAALEAGFHVLCDKPATLNLAEALRLRDIIQRTGRLFGLTYTYSAYAMVKQARELVAAGRLGEIRTVKVEYLQGWLVGPAEANANKQAEWRVDPQRAGIGGSIADIGVHALHLAEYITQLKVREVCADLTAFGAGRVLDDDANILVRYDSGARGHIACSQICVGEQNGLRIRVYGTHGGLEWNHGRPEQLILRWEDQPMQVLYAGHGSAGLMASAASQARLPGGHPEGYIEAFANIYRAFAKAVRMAASGATIDYAALDIPSIDDGIRGMAFIEQSVASGSSSSKWLKLPV